MKKSNNFKSIYFSLILSCKPFKFDPNKIFVPQKKHSLKLIDLEHQQLGLHSVP